MTLLSRVRSVLTNKSSFKEQKDIVEDRAEITLIASQTFVGFVNLWPVNRTSIEKWISAIMVMIESIHILSLFVFLTLNTADVQKFAEILSSMGASMQSVTKGTLLFYKSKELHQLIHTVRYEFLPSNLISPTSEDGIAKFCERIFNYTVLQYSSAFLSRTLCVIIPLFASTRRLPYDTWCPFDWSETPAYQIIYAIQSCIAIYVDVNVVVGYDALYYAICANCVMQFQLLHETIRTIGTGNEKEMAEKLLKTPGLSYEASGNERDGDERRLLVLCIKHHQKLLFFCKELNRIFGDGHFLQYCTTLVGICPTLYQMSQDPSLKNVPMLLAYYIAHLCQLFIYCSVSNELSILGISISDAAYESLWYKKEYKEIRECLLLMMTRSRMIISMNAFGLFELSYISFLSIVRFSFSLYTFLSKMAN